VRSSHRRRPFGGRVTLGAMSVTAAADGDLPAGSDEPFALP
jgi:hypothetical protein